MPISRRRRMISRVPLHSINTALLTTKPSEFPGKSSFRRPTEKIMASGAGTTTKAEPNAPASPPLPTRHTAVTPGPRATRLQELYAQSLAHTLNKVSWDNLAACYPTIAKGAPNLLRGVRKTMVERLEEMCNVS
jgi:kinetochore protein NNF1